MVRVVSNSFINVNENITTVASCNTAVFSDNLFSSILHFTPAQAHRHGPLIRRACHDTVIHSGSQVNVDISYFCCLSLNIVSEVNQCQCQCQP